jgi:hypothetical protein
MPRKKRTYQEELRPVTADLVRALATELKSNRESGQPLIEEQEYVTGKIRVNVIWDKWDHIPLENRTATIFRAYENAEGPGYRDKIALASGLTVPEAHASGMLPFQIIPAVRRGDPVNLEQCRQAMIDEGASMLFGADKLQLRFATEHDAEACCKRLIQHLPGSDQVWIIEEDVPNVEAWAHSDAE